METGASKPVVLTSPATHASGPTPCSLQKAAVASPDVAEQESGKLKILIVSTQLPFPLTEGAKIRVFHLIKQLTQRHEIYLASLVENNKEAAFVEGLRPYCKEIRLAEHRRSLAKRYLQMFLAPWRRQPYLVTINYSAQLQSIVDDLAKRVDITQAEFPYGGQYIAHLNCVKVLDQHNVESDILLHKYQFERSLYRKIFFYLQFKKMKRFEAALCRRMNILLAMSDEDKTALQQHNHQVFVVPNGVEEINPLQRSDNNDSSIVTFTGLMSYDANNDAMLYFCEHIWPLITKQNPKGRLFIVGKKPTQQVLDLQSSTISVTGEVESVKEYLSNTTVFVAPLRIGSGTRLKILEAMSCGIPVVSTTLGCMGIKVTHGKNIQIADQPETFAQEVTALMQDPKKRTRIADAGMQLVRDHYTWNAIALQLDGVYRQCQLALSQP